MIFYVCEKSSGENADSNTVKVAFVCLETVIWVH